MPHPQDVAVPSLPRELNDMLSSELAQHVENYARAAVIADRAAGRASAEPERVERAEPCPKPGCNAHWGITCSEGHMRLKNCPHWCAPTPTASIAPKGEADGVCVKCGVYPSEPCPMPDPDECIQREDATPVAQAAAEASTHDLEIAERGVERLLDALLPSFEYVGIALRVSAEDHAAIRSAMAGARTSLQLIRNALATPVAQAAAGASEHLEEIRAVLQGAHTIMESLAAIEKRVGPVGSHARGYTHKITNALKHLDALARPEADADRASGGGAPEWYDAQDEVALTRAVSVMNDVLSDIAGWEDKELEDAVKDSKIDLMAMIECIRMNADDTYVPGSKPIDGETFGATPITKD